jgi:alkaline phosphatase D
VTLDIKALVTITPPQLPTFTPTPTLRSGETPEPTPTPFGFCGTGANVITNGPRVGMTTDHSASVWVRSCQAASISVLYKIAGSDWSSALGAGPVSTNSGADNTALVPLNNLQTDTTYEYRVQVDGALPAQPLEGHFRTMPAEGEEAAFSFFIGTDMHLSDFPMTTILDSVAEHNPLFGVLGGDSVLVETFQVPPISQRGYDASYRVRLANEAFQQFQRDIPLAFLWSDHEIYNDWDHRTSPPYPYARRTFDAYLGAGNPPLRDPAGTEYTFKAGEIEFYVLDDRTFRSPGERPDGPNKTMLGAQQKQDLKNWLMTSGARFKFIVSDVWWNDFSGHTAYGESWPAYRTERNELFDFIRDNDIPGVVLISGDEHQDGVFRIEPWGLYEIAPGPMSWTPSLPLPPDPQILFRGQFRVFGIFSVDTTACPATLDINLYGETNNLLFSLPLTERDLGADVDGNGLVPCEEGTPAPTPTRTPTPTGTRGDANCDGRTDAIDAALILQRTAGLLNSLPCAQNADVNRDGRVDAVDASLVLQRVAGLLDAFP